jgi:hypothetical protein
VLVSESAVFYDDRRHAFVDLVDPSSATGRRRVPVQVGVGNGTKMQSCAESTQATKSFFQTEMLEVFRQS